MYQSENQHQNALNHLLKALDFDDTEVFMMYKLGQLALMLNHLPVASYTFQKVSIYLVLTDAENVKIVKGSHFLFSVWNKIRITLPLRTVCCRSCVPR